MTATRTHGRVAGGVLLCLGVTAGASCEDEVVDPRAVVAPVEPLGIFAPARPSDPIEAARDALLRDARRREARFAEAAQPGFVLARSSPLASDVFSGQYAPDVLFEFGAQLFHHHFTLAEGLGTAEAPFPTRVQRGAHGATETTSCVSCHARGGAPGAGDAATNTYLFGDGDAPSTGLTRNARSLAGAGFIERLAVEMTQDLAAWRAECLAAAREEGREETAPLLSKGVDFGMLRCTPAGEVDTRDVVGVDETLIVRPFGWKGTTRTLRDAVASELETHLGLERERGEVTEGQIASITAMLALGDAPIVELPDTAFAPVSLWAEGRALFDEIGCASCHVPSLPLDDPRLVIARDDGDAPGLVIDLELHGSFPKPARTSDGIMAVRLFSDLKRHDLGDALADERDDRGVDARIFITPPLWDVARSRPYLHDGRAPTLHDAIVQHGGEAADARDAYVALGEEGQGPLRVFLMSLTREKRYASP